ncbi:hypothetical protein NDU88_003116 [Pleurodeles waltl]|uniref:Uncharacterized protein n=1 Tax=Pleurodeles waltl TaxID=8319 RepID=A0AAV7Q839_PLEWA|nr:hypothetical protein NDU88_003116 [Pleurodeles waltl]
MFAQRLTGTAFIAQLFIASLKSHYLLLTNPQMRIFDLSKSSKSQASGRCQRKLLRAPGGAARSERADAASRGEGRKGLEPQAWEEYPPPLGFLVKDP